MLTNDYWEFFLLGLATFRLTRLIVFDKITEFIRVPFFDEVVEVDDEGKEETFIVPKSKGIRKFFGELLSCYWCTGIWVTIFLIALKWYIPLIADALILILAVAAFAAIVETIISYLLG